MQHSLKWFGQLAIRAIADRVPQSRIDVLIGGVRGSISERAHELNQRLQAAVENYQAVKA